MRVVEGWTTDYSPESTVPTPIWSICKNVELLLAPRLSVVECVDLKTGRSKPYMAGHKAPVLAMASSSEGGRVVSADASGVVIVWKETGEGIVKYSHDAPVRCVAINPINQRVISGSNQELGLWRFDNRSIEKIPLESTPWCMKWAAGYTRLIVGLFNGVLIGFDGGGTCEIWRSVRPKTHTDICWCLDIAGDLVVVGLWCLDPSAESIGQLIFVSANTGKSELSPVLLHSSCPTSLCALSDRLVLVGQTSGNVDLYSITNGLIARVFSVDGWALCLCVSQVSPIHVHCGTSNGRVSSFHITFQLVHGLNKTRYAVRDNECLTDVLFSLSDDRPDLSGRILCNSFVNRVAVFKDLLAVDCKDASQQSTIMIFSIRDSSLLSSFVLTGDVAVVLLLISSMHVVICSTHNTIRVYSFHGVLVNETKTESPVRYMKVLDGLGSKETLLGALADGSVFTLGIASSRRRWLIPTKHYTGIRSVDLNLDKSLLTVVDDNSILTVYASLSSRKLFTVCDIVSAVFSDSHPYVLFASDGNNNVAYLCTTDQLQSITLDESSGVLVGAQGNKLLSIHGSILHVAVQADIHKLSDNVDDFDRAFDIHCLGAPGESFTLLGIKAIHEGRFEDSKTCFSIPAAYPFLDALRSIQDDPNMEQSEVFTAIEGAKQFQDELCSELRDC